MKIKIIPFVLSLFFVSSAFGQKLNVLFLTIDSFRADKLSCYGFEKKTTPNIDKLCDEGIVFLKSYAVSGWTSPSLVSIFSSLYPARHKVETRGFVLNRNFKTPVELLREKGWYVYGQHAEGDTIGNLGFYPTEGTIFEFLRKVSEPFFVWYHLRTPHLPYNPKYVDEFSGGITVDLERISLILKNKMIVKGKDVLDLTDKEKAFVHALYESDVKLQDDEIGQIIDFLKEIDLWNRTIVVITADHGEELFEHGWIGHASTSLDGHLYPEILEIPFIIRIPGFRKTLIRTPVSQVDFMPIILSVLRVPGKYDTDSSIRVDFDGEHIKVERKTDFIFASTSPCGWQCKEEEKWKRIYSLWNEDWRIIYYNYTDGRYLPRFEFFGKKKDFDFAVKKLFEFLAEFSKEERLPEIYVER